MGENANFAPLQTLMVGNAAFVVTRSCMGIPYISASHPFLRRSNC